MSAEFVIGVTGHRDLCEEELGKLKTAVSEALRKIREANPGRSLVMLNSLAAGADQLCAGIALEEGICLRCPLPMKEEEYAKDFSGAEAERFHTYLTCAEKAFVSPHKEAKQNTRDYLYRQAGLYVADHSDVLLALWDGKPGKINGCGTAEIMEYKMICGGAVLHIPTNRKGTFVTVKRRS